MFIATLNKKQNVIGTYEVPADYKLGTNEVFITESQYLQFQLIITVQKSMVAV